VSGPAVVCDPGLDDMVALMVLTGAGCPPDTVVATAGNAPLPVVARNTAAIVELLGLEATLALGDDRALDEAYAADAGAHVHGPDALGGLGDALPDPLPASWEEPRPDRTPAEVLVTSPLTWIARALDAGAAPRRLVWMGGALETDGNTTACAEFNAFLDPPATDAVLRAGLHPSVVPLDITDEVAWSPAEFTGLGTLGRCGRLTAEASAYLSRWGPVRLPDAVAAVAFLDPGLFEWREVGLRCDTGIGPTRGMTYASPGTATASVAVRVDGPAVKAAVAHALAALP
jgi:inosine-uridine nucleoside N-ribohydrolase